MAFLSTLSLRRATIGQPNPIRNNKFLSTLSLRRATNNLLTSFVSSADFYPRSPCGERHLGAGKSCNVRDFYPRSPCGERRYVRSNGPNFSSISIHALLAESDIVQINKILDFATNFYPRSPCGERLVDALILADAMLFLSTLSLRRATSALWMALNRLLRFLSTLSLRRATICQERQA